MGSQDDSWPVYLVEFAGRALGVVLWVAALFLYELVKGPLA